MRNSLRSASRFFVGAAALAKPFRPPFKGLASICWFYFIFCYLFVPHSYVWRGSFVETDNYTYLAQTLEWIQGQGWYDNVQHRLDPPEGVFIHFNRLAEIPIAALTLVFRAFHLPWVGAATLAAMVYPPVLLLGLFWATRWVSESFLPGEWAGVSAFLIMFSQALLFQFSLGHVGHRAPELILILLATGCVFRTMEFPQEPRWSAGAALLLALSLALGLEALPWVLVLSAWIGVWLVGEGLSAVRSILAFALTLVIAAIGFLFLYRPPRDWFVRELMSYSYVYVELQAGIALCLLGTALAAKAAWTPSRPMCAFSLFIFSVWIFLKQFPELLRGPYGAMDKNLAEIFFGFIPEARPLAVMLSPTDIFLSLGAPFLAVAASSYFFWKAQTPKRWAWSLVLVLLLLAIFLTIFYQLRFFRYANLFAVVPLSVFLQRGWQYIDKGFQGSVRSILKVSLFLLVGPLFAVFIPELYNGHSFERGVLMYPAPDINNACDLQGVEEFLESPYYYGKKPMLIMNTMSSGPEILFRTFHKVMAAPYHYNVRGNLDDIHFFGADTAQEAELIAIKDNIDLVLICKFALNIYRHNANATPFIDQLKGGIIPSWLKLVEPGRSSNFLLFEVDPSIFNTFLYHKDGIG